MSDQFLKLIFSPLGDPEAECTHQGEGVRAGQHPLSAGPREGPGDPEAAGGPGGEGAGRGHQDRSLLVAGRGGRPAARPARSDRQGVPGAAGQAGEREDWSRRRSGGAVSAADRQGGVCSRFHHMHPQIRFFSSCIVSMFSETFLQTPELSDLKAAKSQIRQLQEENQQLKQRVAYVSPALVFGLKSTLAQ